MPQQLIYTSAPRGVVPGRSGYCTVARSTAMREPLALRLEQLSYYHHLSLSGGQERPIFTCRIVDIRGARFHVLSRIQDAGLDFTGRTNFIAHHFVATPEEIGQLPAPPVILRDWSGWLKSWTKEPQLLDKEDWSGLSALAGKSSVPAQTWQQVTGDAVNGYGLLEVKPGTCFRVEGLAEDVLLGLLAESLELLETRDTRKDFRNTAWQYTFTTSLQEQDNPADFRWRCVHPDNPAAAKIGDCPLLTSVRAARCTDEETAFARSGRQPPRFAIEPQDVQVSEGQVARLTAKAEGVPNPACQWFSVDRANSGKILTGETKLELTISNPPLGISRYVVRASNSAGEATSRTATVSVDQKLRLSQPSAGAELQRPIKRAVYQKSSEEIDRNREKLQAEQSRKRNERTQRRNKLAIAALILFLIVVVGACCWFTYKRWQPQIVQQPSFTTNNGVVLINVSAIGKEPLFYLWFAADKSPVLLSTNLHFELTNNYLTNPGSFFVKISNVLGTLTSASVQWPGALQTTALPAKAINATNTAAPSETVSGSKSPLKNTMYDLDENSNHLPSPWITTNLGNIMASTHARQENNFFVLTGAGKQIYGTNDEGFFIFQNVSNFKEISARIILPIAGTFSNRLSGIMFRESERAESPFVFIGVSTSSVLFRTRPSSGVACFNVGSTNFAGNQLFLKLSQEGAKVTGWFSHDGNFKNPISDAAIVPIAAMTNCLIGFVVCSGSAKDPATAKFDKINIEPKTRSGN